ncbi:MAG: lysophospholipid acyltransferase family protein [Chromatiaceae bacterium]|nr:lysophospholipid acyltransferase family protein [Chromatiaceae bacterium]
MIVWLIEWLSRLPLWVNQHLGVLFGWVLYHFSNRERDTARVNIKLCFPQLTTAQQEQMLRLNLIESARTLFELPAHWRRGVRYVDELLQLGEGAELPEQMLRQRRGLIFLTPHLGAWELGAHYIARLAPTTILYRPPREPALEHIITRGRAQSGARPVPTSPSGVKALYQALHRHEIVGILPDQQPRHASKSAGVFAPFFDIPALTMVLVNRLVRQTGAAVLYTYVERLPAASGYRMHFFSAPDGVDDPDPVVAATALNQGVEACVRRCPLQYQWSYRRFSVRPDGGRSPYKR